MAFEASCSPERSAATSADAMSLRIASSSRSSSPRRASPPSSEASSAMASRSLKRRDSVFQSLSARSRDAFSFKTVFALSLPSQKPVVSVRRVSSSRRASLAGVSKMPPQGLEPAFDIDELLFEVFQKHSALLYDDKKLANYTIVTGNN